MALYLRRRRRYFGSRKKKPAKAFLKEALMYLVLTVLAVTLGILVANLFFMRCTNVGESMEPQLYNGQSVLVNRAQYLLFRPKAGDVVVFYPNGNQSTHFYIKRVVATPGDTVQIKDNLLYVNGAILSSEEDDYDLIENAGLAENEILLKEDEYFVLGDNRNSSEDSRSDNIGPVKRAQIIGGAWFQYGNVANATTGFVK